MNAIQKIMAPLAGVALLGVLVMGVSFWMYGQISDATALREQTSSLIDAAEDALSELKDAESAQRGFLLTNNVEFLEPYFEIRDTLRPSLAELLPLTHLDEARQHLVVIIELVDARLNHLARLVEMAQANQLTSAQDIVSTGDGEQLMDAVRAAMSAYIQVERAELARNETQFQSSRNRLLAMIVAASLLIVTFSLLILNLAYRNVLHERRREAYQKTLGLLETQEEMNAQLTQANATLLLSEERLSVTLNSIGDAVITTDAQGHVMLLNPLAERLTGWTQAEALGKLMGDVFHIIDRVTGLPSANSVKETLAHGATQAPTNNTVLIANDDREVRIRHSYAPIRESDGSIVGAVAVFRDVTAEFEAQEALRDSAALIRTILNTVVDGIITLQAADGVVATVNPAAENMFGYSTKELIGQDFRALIPELAVDQPDGLFGHDRETQDASTKGLTREVMGRHKNGRSFPIEMVLSEMWLGGKRYFTGILRDISARREVEAELVKSGALQSAIFNSANFSSIATDAKGVIQIFNVGAERMLGYSAADVIDKITPADISDPQEIIVRAEALSVELGTSIAPGFDALVFKATRGIEDIYELTYFRKDGSRFPAVVSVTALRDAQNTIIGYLLIGTDNTARKRAEEALVKAGALQSAIFNSANFSSIATDAKGVIQIFNVGAERMLGYAAADVMNKITPADISDPQEVIARAAALSAELSTTIAPGFDALVFKASRGIEDIYELSYIRKNGSRFPAIVSVTALRDAQDGIIGYLLIGTDNTARKQVEAEQLRLDKMLREQQFYTRSLIESNVDALMAIDPTGIITDVNKQTEALTAYSRDELVGTPFKNYFTDDERAEAGIGLVLSSKTVTNYELTARTKDGVETVVSFNATTFYDQNQTLQGVFASARDITESKRLDRVLQEKNTELEIARAVADKANLAKSDFLSSMSHELRTPLNAILGFAQLMETGLPVPTPPQKRSIEQILKAGWYLLDLINEILDLALIESGRVTLSLEVVSLVEVILECRAMVEPQAEKRGIVISFPRFALPYFVKADRTRVKQVLINLLFNAIKYNVPGGSVVVECTPADNNSIRISVRDTGAGLAPEMLTQLFQPFNRLGKESSSEEGTGIGLVVTKRLVELMGGRIGADSEVGVGSVFWVELALTTEPQLIIPEDELEEITRPVLLDGASLRTLLYVEDNPANLDLVEQLVARRPDLRLLSAADGNVGVEFARDYLPEVILMDINLPGISGIDAMKILRADSETSHIPIIALSANAVPRDIETALNAGFFGYLTKPIKVSEFMETLDLALSASQEALQLLEGKNEEDIL